MDRSIDEMENVKSAIHSLQNSSEVKVIAIGIGDYVRVDSLFLYTIAGNISSNVFRSQDASGLDKIKDDVVNQICEGITQILAHFKFYF